MPFQKRRRRNAPASSTSSDVGQMMNLALFIMLLAFFIVLNAISSYEEVKSEKVKRSVELAFSKSAKPQQSAPSTRPDPTQGLKEGHTFDRLDALFESQIASFEASQSKSQGVMMVRVPFKDFSEAVMALGQKNLLSYPSRREIRGNFFLPTLSSLMRANIDGAPTRMEILLNINDNPAEAQNLDPKAMQEQINIVGTFSQKLEGQGVPQKLLNIGLTKGNPQYIDLVFRKYIAFSPLKNTEAGRDE